MTPTIIPTVREVQLKQADDGFTWHYLDDDTVYLGPFATQLEAQSRLFTPVVVSVPQPPTPVKP